MCVCADLRSLFRISIHIRVKMFESARNSKVTFDSCFSCSHLKKLNSENHGDAYTNNMWKKSSSSTCHMLQKTATHVSNGCGQLLHHAKGTCGSNSVNLLVFERAAQAKLAMLHSMSSCVRVFSGA